MEIFNFRQNETKQKKNKKKLSKIACNLMCVDPSLDGTYFFGVYWEQKIGNDTYNGRMLCTFAESFQTNCSNWKGNFVLVMCRSNVSSDFHFISFSSIPYF